MMKCLVLLVVILAAALATPVQRWNSDWPMNGRIIGGSDASIEDVPYQISLQLYNSHYCGGSIISKDWVITAGHCAGHAARAYAIRAGSTEHNRGGTIHRVSKVVLHEDFGTNDEGLPIYDIALLRVETPFEFNKSCRAIELYEQDEPSKVGSMSVITGWGNTGHGMPRVLKLVKVPIVSKQECNKNYSSLGGLPKNQICAAYPEGGKDACQGDSGGPLALNGRLAGLTSWGLGCAQAGYPGVYTEIAAHRSWIESISKV